MSEPVVDREREAWKARLRERLAGKREAAPDPEVAALVAASEARKQAMRDRGGRSWERQDWDGKRAIAGQRTRERAERQRQAWMEAGARACLTCGTVTPLEGFRIHKREGDRLVLSAHCRGCDVERRRIKNALRRAARAATEGGA